MKSLENGLQPHSGASPLFSMRTESLVSSQSCRSVDPDTWCKQALTCTCALMCKVCILLFFVFQRFATEDHLNTHKLKHNMSLTLSAGGKFSSAIFAGLSFLSFTSVYFVPAFLLKESYLHPLVELITNEHPVAAS